MIINNKDKGGRIKTFRKKSLNSDSHQSTYINKPDNHSMNTKKYDYDI
jgi:hypothetical protein